MHTESPICDFGLHQGEKYTSLPASFLNWMVEIDHEKCAFAKQELLRRETAVLKSCSKRN
ncbi:hypothetical protein ABMY35_15020 [Pseudoalteromonas sp. BZB3]|uniref:hypothetical protein n=1 Tax=Pseudoalteromonas sp. BZB3 TaxID=3136670 RepID=UPI0032C3EF03|tara:strand:+ start:1123 stop:1302 length:180 start_codon:yes stop_codon:yes gene_type:complete